MDETIVERVRRLLNHNNDWNYIVRQAAYHGTLALLFQYLYHSFPDNVPKAILDCLSKLSTQSTYRNLALTGELLRLLSLFRKRGIRTLPLKGPALAVAAYGNLSFRQFCDLDILVAKTDILKAKELLVGQGYCPSLKLSANEETSYIKSHHDYKFVRATNNVVVDLQWGVTEHSFSFPFDFEGAWKRRETIVISGVSTFNLAPEDLLLTLCVHGTKHRWGQLKWISDIGELVAAYQQNLDWRRVIDQSRRLGGERMLLLGLSLSHELLGTLLPKKLVNKLANDSSVSSLACQVMRNLFAERSDRNLLVELAEGPLFLWSSRERWRDKLSIAWRYFPEYCPRLFVPNGRDREFVKLPAALSLGYYLVHPVRLVTNYYSEFRRRAVGAGK